MSAVTLGLVLAKRLPRSPLLTAIRRERRLSIVFETYDLSALPRLHTLTRGPTVILADMDAGPGVRTLLRTIRSRFPVVPIVLFDRKLDPMKAQRARNLGAAAVLTRRSGADRFIARLLSIGSRTLYAAEHGPPRLYEQLTPREWDILPYLAQRFSAKEIAEDLTLSYATVRTHIRNIYAKCGVGSRSQAAQLAEALLADGQKGYNEMKEVSVTNELRGRHGRADP